MALGASAHYTARGPPVGVLQKLAEYSVVILLEHQNKPLSVTL
jgi:hypothetical protein